MSRPSSQPSPPEGRRRKTTLRKERHLHRRLDSIGTALGLLGVLVVIASVVARLGGHYYLFGTESRAWLIGGIALMVMACLAKLHVLTQDRLTR